MLNNPVNREQAETRHERARAGFHATAGGGFVADTPEAINLLCLTLLISALRLEIKCPGLKMSRVSASATARKRGFKSRTKVKLLAEVLAYRFRFHPPRAMAACPECKAVAIVPCPTTVDFDLSDGTNGLCHPVHGGCNNGYALPADIYREMAAEAKFLTEETIR